MPRYYTGIRAPLVNVELRLGDARSVPQSALIDSGAIYTLANIEILKELKIDEAALLDSTRISIQFGGRKEQHPGYEWTVDIGFLPRTADKYYFLIESAKVYFTTAPLTRDILIGQRDALERVEFHQRNQAPTPEFVLKLP